MKYVLNVLMVVLSEYQGQKLLKLARETIKSYLLGNKPEMSELLLNEFSDKQGVFVTLHKKGALRGCIGYPMPILSLSDAVVSASKSAAFQDPRFPPLKKDELDKIDLELSVLSVPELIIISKFEDYFNEIVVGKHGLIVKYKFYSGLLLPQVAPEYNWNVEEFLIHTCNKAGLDSEAWKEKDVKIYKFEAQIFNETKKN